jgi:predicted dithiol-disulfide oxidoreductase (DUF899 family)
LVTAGARSNGFIAPGPALDERKEGHSTPGPNRLDRVIRIARERGWHSLRLLSSAGNTYNRDYYGEDASGNQLPSLNVFVKSDGRIRHFYHSELLFAPRPRGQDGRHVDLIWPLWSLFDLTPEGRGANWYPRLRY